MFLSELFTAGLGVGDDSAISPEDRELPFVFVLLRLPMRLQNDNASARRAMASVVFISCQSPVNSAVDQSDRQAGSLRTAGRMPALPGSVTISLSSEQSNGM